MKTPSIKPNMKTTIHRDGTASVWNVYLQQWERLSIASILTEKHDLLASLSQNERDELNAAFRRMKENA